MASTLPSPSNASKMLSPKGGDAFGGHFSAADSRAPLGLGGLAGNQVYSKHG